MVLHIVCSQGWARPFAGEISRFRRIGISVHKIHKGNRLDIYRVPLGTLETLNSERASGEDCLTALGRQGIKGVN